MRVRKKTRTLGDMDGVMIYDDVLYLNENNVNEGLIRSYSASSVEKYLMSIYPNIVRVHNYHTGVPDKVPEELGCEDFRDMGIEFSAVIRNNFDNIKDINKTVCDLCGWFPYVVRVGFLNKYPTDKADSVFIKYEDFIDEKRWNIDFKVYMYHFEISCIEIYYLAKFGNLGIMNNNIFVGKWLYHTTSIKRISHIEKNGLCPKKRENNEFGLDCIYFSDNIETIFSLTKDRENELVLLRFSGGLIKGIEAQRDKEHKDSYYTNKNINPRDIEIYTEYGWLALVACIGKEEIFKNMTEIIKDYSDKTMLI